MWFQNNIIKILLLITAILLICCLIFLVKYKSEIKVNITYKSLYTTNNNVSYVSSAATNDSEETITSTTTMNDYDGIWSPFAKEIKQNRINIENQH